MSAIELNGLKSWSDSWSAITSSSSIYDLHLGEDTCVDIADKLKIDCLAAADSSVYSATPIIQMQTW
jgi:hypothetical protein